MVPDTVLSDIGDEGARRGVDKSRDGGPPMALFDGPRVDFSLARLKATTPPRHPGRGISIT